MLRAGKRQATKMKVGHNHRFRVGQDCLGLVRERLSIKRQRCWRQRTREIFRDLCDVESASLGRTRGDNSRLCVKSKKERKEARILGPPGSSISLRTEGTTVQVCGEQSCGEVDQWDLCDGT